MLRGPIAQCRGVKCAKNNEYNDYELPVLFAVGIIPNTHCKGGALVRMVHREMPWVARLGGRGLLPPSQILALCVYNMQTLSTIGRPRLLGADSVYGLQTATSMVRG